MNTNTTIQISDSANNVESTPKPTVRTLKFRHRIVAFLATAILLATGVNAASATPANAATTAANGTVSACFKAPSGYGWGTYDRPVFVDVWVGGTAHQIGTVTPASNGCIRQALPAGYYWRFRVYHYERGAGTYNGTSNWAYVSAGGSANVGTVWLSLIRG